MSGGGFNFGSANPSGMQQLAGSGFSFGQAQTTTSAANKGFFSTPSSSATSGGGFSFGTLGGSGGTTTITPLTGGATITPLTGGAATITPLTGGAATITPLTGGAATITPLTGAVAPTPVAASPFGAPAAATTQAAATPGLGGFSFGGAAAATPASTVAAVNPSGFSFGTAAPTTAASLNTQTSTVPSLGGFSFGTSTTSAPAASTSSGFSFGGTQPAAGTSTGSGFSFGTSTLTPAASAPSTGFSLGGTAAPSPGFSFGGLGTQSATPQASNVIATSTVGLGGAGMGLGGAQPPSANAGTNSAGAKADGKSAKKQQVPQDLFNMIAVFESWKNRENASSEENIRQTAAPFDKVGKKAGEIQQHLAELTSEHLQLHASAANLKAEVMKEAEHVEMARRTKDTPMALQGENKAPENYFINLVRSFEAEMIYCRNKIEEVSLCMQAANNPCETPDDIAEVLQREHELLKELAAKVYAKHSQLVELSQYLKTKAAPNDEAFFRTQSKQSAKTPASAIVRPAMGGSSSGLQAFQEQQQRAKAVTIGAAPPTMPLTQTSTPSLFGSSSTGPNMFSGGSAFGSSTFNIGNTSGSSFNSKSLFGNTSTGLNSFGMNQTGIQQSTSPFSMSSSFTAKPFEEDSDGRRKRRL